MVGNLSVPAVSLGVLALHATILTPPSIVAEEASAAVDNKYWNKGKSKQKHHLRRQGDSQERPLAYHHEYVWNEYNPQEQQRGQGGRSRNTLECSSIGWHADMNTPNGCTDDDIYPPAWLDVAVKSTLFHATPEICCSTHFPGEDCAMTHSGCGSDNPPTTGSCVSPGWHADMITQDGCTNGADTYLQEWLQPLMKSSFFFSSAQECCDVFFNGNCKIQDAGCTIGSDLGSSDSDERCESEWHPDAITKTGCTNDKTDYPPAWRATPSTEAEYFFSTAYNCCEKYHQSDGSCPIRDACMSDDITNIQITANPTTRPTSALPTPLPTTLKPTPAPAIQTQLPSSSPSQVYYVEHISGLCLQDSQIKKPYYITNTYGNYDECCQNSHDQLRCQAKAPSPPPTIAVPTISPRPTTLWPTYQLIYYVEHFSGTCVESTSDSLPHYIIDTFMDYRDCCNHSFVTEECLKEGPTRVPTYVPTAEDTVLPSSQPTVVPSPQPSGQPSEPSKPTTSPTTFYWSAYMSFTSKPTFRPTKMDCSDLSWHVDTDAIDQGCTNYDLNLNPTESAVLLFQSAEECCVTSFNGLDCSVRDNCKLTNTLVFAEWNIPQPGDICDNYWHPDIDYDRDGCSNSLNFPESWMKSTVKASMLYDTPQECCQKLYFDHGNHCKLYNHCTTESPTKRPTVYPTPRPTPPTISLPMDSKTSDVTSCESAKWHISIGSQEMGCSNSLTYPKAWNDSTMQSKFLFDSHSDCCARFSAHDPSACGKHDVCLLEVSTATSPAAVAPRNSGVKPCVSAKWHMARDFSKCSNDFGYPLSWLEDGMRYFFNDPKECCVAVFNYEGCEIEDICASSDVVSTTPATTAASTKAAATIATATTSTATSSPGTTVTTTTDLVATTSTTTTSPNEAASTSTTTSATTPTIPITAPPLMSHALDMGLSNCRQKNRRQCFQHEVCQYDKASRTCMEAVPESKTATAPSPNTTATDATSPNSCGGMPKRLCEKDPECSWERSEKSCSQQLAATANVVENEDEISNILLTQLAATASQNCDERKWHPKTITDRACSNSDAYPPLWDNPAYPGQYLFNSYEQCCETYYNGRCDKEDVCEATDLR